ncbi:MAG: OB-fold domain-containing protein [Candidatus Protistobacter heckmanni]|nr:OB-fold domain-containing protein [Candidatus Protistobacter heckmanni]
MTTERDYFARLAAGTFSLQRCGDCQRAVFFPRIICPHCGGEHLKWTDTAGAGEVYSTTVVRRKPDAGGDYNVALIHLDEGVQLMSCVVGMPPAEVRIGMRVKARIEEERVVFALEAGQ